MAMQSRNAVVREVAPRLYTRKQYDGRGHSQSFPLSWNNAIAFVMSVESSSSFNSNSRTLPPRFCQIPTIEWRVRIRDAYVYTLTYIQRHGYERRDKGVREERAAQPSAYKGESKMLETPRERLARQIFDLERPGRGTR